MKLEKQIATDEELISFVAENMDEYEPDEPGTEADASPEDDEEDFYEDHVTEDDIARENGFWVDDDGHWRELDEDDDW